MATEFQINWDNFATNWIMGFQESYSRGEFLDVTLAAEGQMLQAHRLVLAACSPLFRKLLLEMPANQHQNPIIYLKDIKMSILQDILYYMYFGKINVKEECLVEFVATAESLDIKGISVEIVENNGGNEIEEENLNSVGNAEENADKTPERTISVTEPKDFSDFESNAQDPASSTPVSYTTQIQKQKKKAVNRKEEKGDSVPTKKIKLIEPQVEKSAAIPYKKLTKLDRNSLSQSTPNMIDSTDKLVLKKGITQDQFRQIVNDPAQFELTNRGTFKLVHNGFGYFKGASKTKSNQTCWACVNNRLNCNAKAFTCNVNGVDYVVETVKTHSDACKSRNQLFKNNM